MGELTLYGAYGSNMNIQQMAQRCPRARIVGTATLQGYKLMFRGSGVANVEEAHHRNCVPLVIWELTPECVKSLDRYEGYPTLYERYTFDVLMRDNYGYVETVEVMIYTMVEKYESRPAMPWESYYDGIRQGYAQNGIGVASLRKALERTYNELSAKQRAWCP
jgi:gamma-glutamylcyclotransferase (GGCT)/AIG2-like uncharacterized protein YtfP